MRTSKCFSTSGHFFFVLTKLNQDLLALNLNSLYFLIRKTYPTRLLQNFKDKLNVIFSIMPTLIKFPVMNYKHNAQS